MVVSLSGIAAVETLGESPCITGSKCIVEGFVPVTQLCFKLRTNVWLGFELYVVPFLQPCTLFLKHGYYGIYNILENSEIKIAMLPFCFAWQLLFLFCLCFFTLWVFLWTLNKKTSMWKISCQLGPIAILDTSSHAKPDDFAWFLLSLHSFQLAGRSKCVVIHLGIFMTNFKLACVNTGICDKKESFIEGILPW